MRNATLLLFLAALLALSSCVTNKKILYLQKQGDLKKKTNPPDTAIRDYDLVDFKYKIQSNDLISVRYLSLTDKDFDFLNTGTQSSGGAMNNPLLMGELVNERGEIPVPVVGKVKVSGLTIFQIQDTLQKIASRYLESPVVKARLINYRATFLGEVGKEGSILFRENRVSLLEALGLAGLSDFADRSNIKLIRQMDNKVEVHYVNLLKEDFINSPFYYVYQNDVIIVPPLKQRPYQKYFARNFAVLAGSVSFLLLLISLKK